MLCNAVRRAASRSRAPIIPTDGLILDYSFNSISGSTIIDGAGNYNGTIYGATSVAGLHGNALSFDGVNDYVLVAGTKTPFASLSALSISALIYVDFASSDDYGAIFGNIQDGGASWERDYKGFTLQVVNSIPGYNMRWFGFGNNGGFPDNGIYFNSPNQQWAHVVCIWDGTGMRIVVNGVPSSRLALAQNYPVGREDFFLGKLPYRNDLYTACVLDNMRVYDRVLTTAEIAELYKEL